jgi:putative addiction module antidote
LRLQKGDTLYATELPDGIKLSAFDPKLEKEMEIAERVMRTRRTLLRKLAAS